MVKAERKPREFSSLFHRRYDIEDKFRAIKRENIKEAETLIVRLQRILHESNGRQGNIG